MPNNREIIQHLLEMLTKFSGREDTTISREDFKDYEKYSISYLKKNLHLEKTEAITEFNWFVQRSNIIIS